MGVIYVTVQVSISVHWTETAYGIRTGQHESKGKARVMNMGVTFT